MLCDGGMQGWRLGGDVAFGWRAIRHQGYNKAGPSLEKDELRLRDNINSNIAYDDSAMTVCVLI